MVNYHGSVLVNDKLAEEGLKYMRENGVEVDTRRGTNEELLGYVGNYDALIVRSSTRVTREVIEAGAPPKGRLKIVGRAGIGIDNIDVDAASYHGVLIKSAPYGNTNAVAELVLGMMINLSRELPQANRSLREGVWKRFYGNEISGKTLGIIGCGNVGQRLSQLASGFMNVVGYDANLDHVKLGFPNSIITYLTKEEVLKRSDVVSIHIRGNQVVMGREELSMMKPDAILINTSRGVNVDTVALYDALASKRIRGAGIDVHEEEPTEDGAQFQSLLQGLDNVLITPHIGASTREAQVKTALEIATDVVEYLSGGDFSNSVNAKETVSQEETPTYPIFFYHEDRPWLFAHVTRVVAEHGVNGREITSRRLGRGAIGIYFVHQRVGPDVLKSLMEIDGIYWAQG